MADAIKPTAPEPKPNLPPPPPRFTGTNPFAPKPSDGTLQPGAVEPTDADLARMGAAEAAKAETDARNAANIDAGRKAHAAALLKKKADDDAAAAKKAAELAAKAAVEVRDWQQTAVGRHVTEHLDALMDRTGGRHRPGG